MSTTAASERDPLHERMAQLRAKLEARHIDVFVVTYLPNVLYLCGFTGSNAILIVLPDSTHLFTDSRYTVQARQEAPAARLHIVRGALTTVCGEFLQSRVPARMRAAFDPAHLSVTEWTQLKLAAGARIRWKAATGLLEALREIKTPTELEIMRSSAKLGSEVMTEVINLVRPGVTELDLAAEVDYRIRHRKGAAGPSF